ncbi:hypothetical protein [Streptomyces sp. NPDC047990]|uniref:hypothetical protein n=1 Tax=Streptomyces sp. NPDC047990 TaxID=3365496 RepID=UPI003716FE1A
MKDEPGDADHAHLSAHRTAPIRLHHVNPQVILQDHDLQVLAAFAATIDLSASFGDPHGT